jgi:hypothetical protein
MGVKWTESRDVSHTDWTAYRAMIVGSVCYPEGTDKKGE